MQSLFIVILSSAGALDSDDSSDEGQPDPGRQLQELLICLEMLPASIAMLWAFNYQDYKGTGKHGKHAISRGADSLQGQLHRPTLPPAGAATAKAAAVAEWQLLHLGDACAESLPAAVGHAGFRSCPH